MLFLWDDRLVGSPEISEAVLRTVGCWNGFPQAATNALTSVSDSIGHHLTRLAAEGNPDPRLVGLFGDKGPQLIQFQDRRSRIAAIRCYQRLIQWGKLCGFS